MGTMIISKKGGRYMARSKNPLTIREEISVIDAKIQKHEKSINELKNQRSNLLSKQYQIESQRLMQALETKGLSVDDAIAKL